jgi:hypothetical protein
MELINGKFYQDGKEVPLEIGNKVQIKLLKEKLAYLEEMEEGPIGVFKTPVDFSVELICTAEIDITFECECGKKIRMAETKDDVNSNYDNWDAESDMKKHLLDTEKLCSCGKKYKFVESPGFDGISAERINT